MKLKIVTSEETLFELEMPESINEELEEKLMSFNKREIVSLQMNFVEGTLVEETSNLDDIDPSSVIDAIITVKK
jgi:hypothetical protein